MRKDQKWSGLVTHASPYLLPRGASQEQVNVNCRTPGVLQTRRGMVRLSSSSPGGVPRVRDVYSLRGIQDTVLLSLTPSGQLVALSEPRPSLEPTGSVYEPQLATGIGQTATNYLWQYQADAGQTSDLVYTFYGGSAAQTEWTYEITPTACRTSALASVSGGRSSITVVRGVQEEALCRHDSN